MKGIIILLIFILLLNNCVCLRMYALQVRFCSYENYHNELIRSNQDVCCDGAPNSDPCEPCDTYFRYCLRFRNPNRISSFECPNNGRTLVSEVNTDDGPLDFSMSTVLGLPNPFVLSGFQDPDNFELLIVAFDSDSLTMFEFVDAFKISLRELRKGQIEEFYENGEKNVIRLELELTLMCAEGYTGELCDSEELVTTAVMVTESPTTETITTELLVSTTTMTTEPSTIVNTTLEPPTTAATIESPTTTAMTAEPTKLATTKTIKWTTKPTMDTSKKTTVLLNKDPSTLSISNTTTVSPTPLENCTDANCSGHGVCVVNENNITCVCQPGFTGPGCIVQTFSEKRGDDTGSIVGGTIGSLTVIIITALMLGVTIILVHRQKHRKQQVNEQDVNIEQHLPPMIIVNENQDYGMTKNVIYGIQLDTGQQHEGVTVENNCDIYDQVREESHIYEDLSECVDHFQMNFNIVYEENEHDYY